MPIHHKIIYDLSTGTSDCFYSASATVELVQHAIVQYNRSYVEQIDIIVSKDSVGNYPTGDFQLTLEDTNYAFTPVTRSILTSDNNSNYTAVTNGSSYVLTFSNPSADGEVLFEFGNGSGPGTKLGVKVKREPPTYSCP